VPPERRAALTEGSGLTALRLLIPPPTSPYLGEGTWNDVFDELGTPLPSEYVTLMNLYGAGTWRYWLRMFIPLRPTFASHIREVLDGYRFLRENHPAAFTLAVWPEPGGFLPFAESVEGDHIGWLTEGSPDDWPLIVDARHAEQQAPLSHGLVDTLVAWTRGQLRVPGFAGLDKRDDPFDFAEFAPASPTDPW